MIRLALALLLLAPAAALAAGGGGHSAPPEDEAIGPDGEPLSYPTDIPPSYHAVPHDIVAAMRARILERRGEGAPAEKAEPAHGSGH